jgi:ribose 5-phosphate isomerase B
VRVALGADEATPLTDALARDLAARGHDVVLVGPIGQPGGESKQWAEVGHEVGEMVAGGDVDTGVVCCWTGTGVSIAANKVRGVRAALCTDAATAAGARTWNDANVLALGLGGLTSPDVAHEMLDAWFATDPDPAEAENIARLEPRG